MHSELHERLEYLVNYSSQLIFVSGDSIAQQQKTLESFVFQQHDDTEIAFVTADPNLDISDYRRQLCRQLLGQVVGSYVRPLNELLAELNEHEGPILITITQAQHMPDRLLQELWDLVLQSRFAANKQHLNVLLFGESQWAENAKQWLPARNTETPLLISSQSVHTEAEGSDLDRLINQRREAFHQRLAQRYGSDPIPAVNRLRSPWFWSAVGALFIASFVALMAWQYGEQLSSLFTPINEQLQPEPSATSVEPGSAFDSVIASTPEPAPVVDVDAPQTEEPVQAVADPLITGWRNAVQQLEKVTAEEPGPAAPTDTQTNAGIEPATQPQPAQVAANTPAEPEAVQTEPQAASSDPVVATAGEPSVEEQVKALQQALLPESQNADSADPTPGQTDTAAGFDNQQLAASLKADDYLIQMAGLQDMQLLQQFINDNGLSGAVKTYQTRRYGGDWYVVVFHQYFTNLQEARAAIAALPDYPSKGEAFVKRGDQILSELAVAQ